MSRIESSSGFSLIEVMVASAILGSTAGARGVGEATLLAWQKLDELRSLALTYDDAGGPVTDASLQPSPGGALSRDTAGWVDYPVTLGTRYRRRWAINLSDGRPDLLILRVRVLGTGREQELASAVAARARRRP